MDLLQLTYFQKLAKTENLTKTAKSLYISPPALSASLSRLENDLGVLLFDRVGNRIVLNASGKLFLSYVDDILESLNNAVAAVQNSQDFTITVATTSPNVWFQLFHGFTAKYPRYTLSHSVIHLQHINPSDLHSAYDFLITNPSDIQQGNLESQVLYDDDSPILLVYPTHPFASKTEIDLSEACEEYFIALSSGFSSRQYFDTLCKLAGFTPQIVMESDYMMRMEMVAQQAGIALSTKRTRNISHWDGLVSIDIAKPFLPRSQSLFWHPKRALSPAAKAFRDYATSFFNAPPTT